MVGVLLLTGVLSPLQVRAQEHERASSLPEAELRSEERQSEARIEAARAAFEAGRNAYRAGHFEEALVSFERAYELTGSPSVLYNVATVAERLQRHERAIEAYRSYLRLQPDAEDRAHIEARIRTLRKALTDERDEQSGGDQPTDRIERPESKRATRVPRDGEPVSDDRGPRGPGPWPWVMTAGGAAVTVGGGVLLLLARRDIEAVEEPAADEPRWSNVEDAYDRAPALSAAGFALLGVGVAALGTGIAWTLAADGQETTVEASVGPGRVRIEGRF